MTVSSNLDMSGRSIPETIYFIARIPSRNKMFPHRCNLLVVWIGRTFLDPKIASKPSSVKEYMKFLWGKHNP